MAQLVQLSEVRCLLLSKRAHLTSVYTRLATVASEWTSRPRSGREDLRQGFGNSHPEPPLVCRSSPPDFEPEYVDLKRLYSRVCFGVCATYLRPGGLRYQDELPPAVHVASILPLKNLPNRLRYPVRILNVEADLGLRSN